MAFSGLIKSRERPQTRRRENTKKTVERERRGGGRKTQTEGDMEAEKPEEY
jgi:hypothetical protein